ncbi:hypothetical protein ZIOFF_027630 [Zingiber officinale]|uniref:Uncharacterized protein n=1 Tax=Zingiber officinale TaxID=94328 RepID=A0A8J5GLQ6_ZINOF|nr:hypothetical protein ZIOFF_027630 [Zingiber officinale]
MVGIHKIKKLIKIPRLHAVDEDALWKAHLFEAGAELQNAVVVGGCSAVTYWIDHYANQFLTDHSINVNRDYDATVGIHMIMKLIKVPKSIKILRSSEDHKAIVEVDVAPDEVALWKTSLSKVAAEAEDASAAVEWIDADHIPVDQPLTAVCGFVLCYFKYDPNAHSSSTFFSSRCRRAQFLSLCVVGFALAFLLAFLLAVAFLLVAAALSFSPSRCGFCPNAPSSVRFPSRRAAALY